MALFFMLDGLFTGVAEAKGTATGLGFVVTFLIGFDFGLDTGLMSLISRVALLGLGDGDLGVYRLTIGLRSWRGCLRSLLTGRFMIF